MPLLPHFCPLSVPEVGYVGYMCKAFEKGYLEHPGLHAILAICLRFSSVACCLFLSTSSHHVRIQIHATRCCIPTCTTKGLKKGRLWRCNLDVDYFFRVKSGYSEAIAWRKVRLTK